MTQVFHLASQFFSTVIAFGTLMTVTLPGLRKKAVSWWNRISGMDQVNQELKGMRSLLEEHVSQDRARKAELELQREVDKCVLRDLITNIYYKYVKEKAIPIYELQDAAALHELYRKRGGNSYVHHIFRQMTEDWEVVQ